ncbi:arginase family protein, partial [Bacillus thuringiensis]|uniref:arginase family protein n=1 Tax=Bacillus thuringiensis TaxID=1428 RepID=UPI0016431ED5
LLIIAARPFDEPEKDFIPNERIKVFSIHQIHPMAMTPLIQQTIPYLSHTHPLHLSLHLHGLDPHHPPGLRTPLIARLSYPQ